jgi:hypothetical protein
MRAIELWADNRILTIEQHLADLRRNNPTVFASQQRMWEDEITRAHAWVESERYWRFVYRPSC